MCRLLRVLYIGAILILQVFATTAYAQSTELEQHLSDEYKGKTLLLRGFYPQDRLLYDSAGSLVGKNEHGDWTADGFVAVDAIQASGPRLVIEARRLLIVSNGRTLQFRAAEQPTHPKKKKQLVPVEITVDFGHDIPTAAQADAALSEVFLTEKDALVSLVPEYWRPCLKAGLNRVNPACAFSEDVLAVPGVVPSASNTSTIMATNDSPQTPALGHFHIGGGVAPPRVIFQRDPEFSERARATKFQGTVALSLVVNDEGVPTHIRIVGPLGCGLDAKAVEAVQGWKFKPSEKDGQPVRMAITVEVNFHLH
jgi:TonB family protein